MEDGGAAGTGNDVGPLGSIGMPVQLSNCARTQPHRDTGDAGRNRELMDACAPRDAPVSCPWSLLLKTVAERWQCHGSNLRLRVLLVFGGKRLSNASLGMRLLGRLRARPSCRTIAGFIGQRS